MNYVFDGAMHLGLLWLLPAAALNVLVAAEAGDGVGTWELTYTVGGRQRTAVLQITKDGSGSLAGKWISGRVQSAVSDV